MIRYLLLVFIFISVKCWSQKLVDDQIRKGFPRDTCIGTTINGLREGKWKCSFDEYSIMEFLHDTIMNEIVLYDDGKTVRVYSPFLHGRKHGDEKFYLLDGTLVYIIHYEKNNRTSRTRFYDTGEIKYKGDFVLEMMETTIVRYHMDSFEQEETQVQQLTEVKNGKWYYYLKNGKIDYTECYFKGKLIDCSN